MADSRLLIWSMPVEVVTLIPLLFVKQQMVTWMGWLEESWRFVEVEGGGEGRGWVELGGWEPGVKGWEQAENIIFGIAGIKSW